jgi:uncharacterized heparinase superfamily protein
MRGPANFTFLNCAGEVGSAADWNAAGRTKLWLYNLHYFDDLNAVGGADRTDWHRALVARWIAENPAGRGNGWEPYPLSLRIVNWIKWVLGGNEPDERMALSLAVQARALRRQIEWHLLGNHLLANAKALVFAGLFFDGEEAEDWLNTGLRIIERELPEQVLADGGHFELSPMYHSLALEDLLDLVNVSRAFPNRLPAASSEDWQQRIGPMRRWLAAMLHPDGGIAFFNDAAHGVAANPSELSSYAERLGVPPISAPGGGVTHLEASGYIRIDPGDMIAILDVGRIGPDYLPGHAHADTLSFELSIAGQRVFVNSGTSLYEGGPKRDFERSTEAHNSVVVDGQNSSEVWASFRVARRAYPFGLRLEEKGDDISVHCAHNGYRRLPGDVSHFREWRFSRGGLTICDRLEGGFERAASHFHLHPRFRVVPEHGAIASPDRTTLTFVVRNGRATVVPYEYHSEFGLSERGECLAIHFDGPSCVVEFRIP